MSMKGMMESWFPGAIGESEAQKALKNATEIVRLKRELQGLLRDRENIEGYRWSEEGMSGEQAAINETDHKIAFVKEKLQELELSIPPEFKENQEN